MATQTPTPEPVALAPREKQKAIAGAQVRITWTEEQVALIQRTVAKGTTPDEFKLFLYQAARSGLDPLARQIYAIKRWNAKENREVMAIQVAIDGLRLIADRTGKYAGSDDATFSGEPLVSGMSNLHAAALEAAATVAVYKLVGGQPRKFAATAWWREYYPGDKGGAMWRSKPHVMLSKVAEALALRKGFPADMSGLYTGEEMDAAGEVIDVKAEPEPEAKPVWYPTGAVDEKGTAIMSPLPGPHIIDRPDMDLLFGVARRNGLNSKPEVYAVASKVLGVTITSIRQIPVARMDDVTRAITGEPEPTLEGR